MTVTAVLNGHSYELTYNESTGSYEGKITAPSFSSYNLDEHKVGVTLTATDEAGNTTTVTKDTKETGSSTVGYANLGVRVKETKAPIINMSTPGADAYLTTATPDIAFTVIDNTVGTVTYDGTSISGDSGITSDNVSFSLKNSDGTDYSNRITLSSVATDGGLSFSSTFSDKNKLDDGTYIISVSATDNDGNVSSSTRQFIVDVAAPSLDITSPADGSVVNNSTVIITGVTSDITSGLKSVVAVITNGSSSNTIQLNVESDGSFNQSVKLSEGTNTIAITATDQAGSSTTVSRTIMVDTIAPIFTSIVVDKSEVDINGQIVIAVKVV